MPPPAMSHPLLSVVVPVHDVERYLAECLTSLLGQRLTDASLEVVAVDDGSSDGSGAILSELAADSRLTVITQPNRGPGAARNAGIAAARGDFLAFCDADDTMPLGALDVLLSSLRRTGSDFAVGPAVRQRRQRLRPRPSTALVHDRERLGVHLDDFPLALHDLTTWSRVFRRDFWDAQVGGFVESRSYGDHLPMVSAYVRARGFDLLTEVTYHWRVRDDGTSITQQRGQLRSLEDRVAARESAHSLLLAEASPQVYDVWVARALDAAWPGYLPGITGGDPEFRALLTTTYRTYLDRATPSALAQVRPTLLEAAHLAADGLLDEALAVRQAGRRATAE